MTENFVTLWYFLYKSLPFYTVVEHNSSASQNTDLRYSFSKLYSQFGSSKTLFYSYCRLLIISISNLYAPFEKCLIKYFSFKRKLFFFNWVAWVICVFWILTLNWRVICKYFLPFHRLPFHFVDGFLCCAETLVWCSLTFIVIIIIAALI